MAVVRKEAGSSRQLAYTPRGLYAKRRNLHARNVNVRNDHHHTAIANSCGRVVVETLNVAGMMRNRRLARAIADAGMAAFLTNLEYKCAWYGAEFEKADRWYALSKLCAHCGWKNDALRLSVVNGWCGGCGVLNDRDANAAENLANWPGLSFPASGRGDRVRPAVPAVVGEASNESGAVSAKRGVSDSEKRLSYDYQQRGMGHIATIKVDAQPLQPAETHFSHHLRGAPYTCRHALGSRTKFFRIPDQVGHHEPNGRMIA